MFVRSWPAAASMLAPPARRPGHSQPATRQSAAARQVRPSHSPSALQKPSLARLLSGASAPAPAVAWAHWARWLWPAGKVRVRWRSGLRQAVWLPARTGSGLGGPRSFPVGIGSAWQRFVLPVPNLCCARGWPRGRAGLGLRRACSPAFAGPLAPGQSGRP